MTRPSSSMAYFGRYSLQRLIARDARGLRYHAYDMLHRRDVALLVLNAPTEPDARAKVTEALQRWLTALRLLNHPNLARVYEVASLDGLLYIVYEHVEGDALAGAFGEAGMAFDLSTVLAVGKQIAAGLQHMHGHRVFYHWLDPRDVVLTRRGRVVLIDVALERFLAPVWPLPASGDEAPGADAQAYVAPEVLRGEPAGAAADVYSLAVLLYRMAAGVTPQDAGRWMLNVPPGALRALGRSLQRDPAQRHGNPDALLAAFERATTQPAVLDALPVLPALPAMPRARGWIVVMALGVLTLGITWLGWRSSAVPTEIAPTATVLVNEVAQPPAATSTSPAPPTAQEPPSPAAPDATLTATPLPPTATPGGTDTPAFTPRPMTDTPTRTPVPTTRVPTATYTPSATGTPLPTVIPSPTGTLAPPTKTLRPPTATLSPPTNTPVPPPPTETPVPPPPTETPVPPPPTDTPAPPPPTDTPPPPP